jgi:hypothetical protein
MMYIYINIENSGVNFKQFQNTNNNIIHITKSISPTLNLKFKNFRIIDLKNNIEKKRVLIELFLNSKFLFYILLIISINLLIQNNSHINKFKIFLKKERFKLKITKNFYFKILLNISIFMFIQNNAHKYKFKIFYKKNRNLSKF